MVDSDNTKLRALVAECKGCSAELGARLGITRQAANERVHKAKLSKFASDLRKLHGIRGTREEDPKDTKKEKRQIEAALKEHGSQSAAARALGIGRTRLQRSMERLGIG